MEKLKTFGHVVRFTKEVDGEQINICMKSSVGLLGLYKSYFYTDIMSDITKMLKGISQQDMKDFAKIDPSKKIEDYTNEEIETLLLIFERNTEIFDTSILVQIMVALILNAVPEEQRPAMPEALDVVPAQFLTDSEIITAAINLVIPFLGQKKN